MKRHPALVELSRDHHHALVLARRLRRATDTDAVQVRAAFLAHWEGHERAHFRLEEEVLLPAFSLHGDPGEQTIARVLSDHLLIRRDAMRLADGDADERLLHELGERLAAHVELEERELFPLIERTLGEDELTALGQRLGG